MLWMIWCSFTEAWNYEQLLKGDDAINGVILSLIVTNKTDCTATHLNLIVISLVKLQHDSHLNHWRIYSDHWEKFRCMGRWIIVFQAKLNWSMNLIKQYSLYQKLSKYQTKSYVVLQAMLLFEHNHITWQELLGWPAWFTPIGITKRCFLQNAKYHFLVTIKINEEMNLYSQSPSQPIK